MKKKYKDYYRILELHPKASIEMIKKAKRILVLRYHPDHNRDKQDWAHEKTKDVLEAYDVLSNSEKRAHYDKAYYNRFYQKRGRPFAEDFDEQSEPQDKQQNSDRYARHQETPHAKKGNHAQQRYSVQFQSARVKHPADETVMVTCPHCKRESRLATDANLANIKCGNCSTHLKSKKMPKRLKDFKDHATEKINTEAQMWREAWRMGVGFLKKKQR